MNESNGHGYRYTTRGKSIPRHTYTLQTFDMSKCVAVSRAGKQKTYHLTYLVHQKRERRCLVYAIRQVNKLHGQKPL